MSSPFIVAYDPEIYSTVGWMGIGFYDFNIYDGLYRSLYFFCVTSPVIATLYYLAPRNIFSVNYSKIFLEKKKFTVPIIWFFIILSLISLTYDLGINGVEIQTTFKLSGIVYYTRSYISVIFITIYIFQKPKPSFLFVFFYALVVGYTSVSRFTAVTPLFLILLRELIDSKGKISFKIFIISFSILFMFSVVTFIRLFFYEDGYTFSKTLDFFSKFILNADQSFWFQGVNQLFLRIGIGRDVILSYEVANAGNCTDYIGLFFNSGSCTNPPLDFYGLDTSQTRFALAPPQLSSLFVVSNNFFVQLFFSLLYSLEIFILIFISKKLCKFPYGEILFLAAYFFILLFALIGPIRFVFYIIIGLFLLYSSFHLLKTRRYVTS